MRERWALTMSSRGRGSDRLGVPLTKTLPKQFLQVRTPPQKKPTTLNFPTALTPPLPKQSTFTPELPLNPDPSEKGKELFVASRAAG
eukprot:1001889-Rhodomonas_salina.1